MHKPYVFLTMRFSAGTLSAMLKSAKKISVFFIYLALALSTVAVFWQVRNFDFVNYDDPDYVSKNQHVLNGLTPDSFIWAFTTGHSANWHPLTWLSLTLDCQLFGPDPGRMHLVNVLLHIMNTLLLFAVLRKMTSALWPSAFVAAVFALHPMHVESVAWIAERKDVLSTFFFMLTLLAYCRYTQKQNRGRYFLALLTFALGLMAKPMLVTLPFVLLLLDYWPLSRFGTVKKKKTDVSQKSFSYLVLEKLPLLVLAAVSSIITFFVQRSSGAVADINDIPLQSRVANALVSYAEYVGKMFWPTNLAIFYPFPEAGLSPWQITLCVLLLIVISIFVIRLGRGQKYLPVGWVWFTGTMVPVVGLVQVGLQAYADRYTYIPYIGLFIMIAWGLPELLSKLLQRKIVLGLSMAVILVSLGIVAHRQTGYWKNNYILFSHALEVTQNNYLAHSCFAEELRKQNKITLAIEHYTRAIQISPHYAIANLGLGSILADQGDLNQALGYFQKTLQQLEPGSVYAAYTHYCFGSALQKQNKFGESIAHFVQAVQIIPDFTEARNDLAYALIQQGRLDEALDQFREVLRIMPDWSASMKDLAWLIATHPEIKDRNVNEAISLASHACELTSYKDPAVIGTLAAAYAAAGRFPEAIETAKRAIAIADDVNQPQIKNIIQNHLGFYAHSKPYIEPAPQPLSSPVNPKP